MLTRLLQLQPSRIWIQREVHKGHTVRYTRYWEYAFRLPSSVVAANDSEIVEKHLEAFLGLLEPHAKAIFSLSENPQTQMGLECIIGLDEDNGAPGLDIRSHLAQIISALGLYLRLTFLSEESDEDENNHTYVCFSAENYSVSPDTITELMQIEPTEVRVIGEPIPGRLQKFAMPSRRNSWELKSSLSFSEDVLRHLEHFLPQLLPHVEAISALKDVYHADTCIVCAINYYQEQVVIHFLPEIMRDLGTLGLDLTMDLYFCGRVDSEENDKPKSQRESDRDDNFHVAFEAHHDTLTAKAITDLLGLNPTRKQRHHPLLTGSKARARNHEHKDWVLQSALLNKVAPDLKIMALLQILEPRAAAFQQFKQEHAGHLNLRCYLHYRDNPAHLHLTQDMLQSLGKLGCSLELNMGFPGRHPVSQEITQITMTGPYAAGTVFQTEYHIGDDEAQAQVWFTCFDHSSDPVLFVSQIPLQPSASQCIGQAMPHDPESHFAQNSWTLYSPLPTSAPVAKQIQALLEQLTPHAAALLSLQQQGDTEMGIHCLIYGPEHWMELAPELVCALGQLGLYLNLEVHRLE